MRKGKGGGQQELPFGVTEVPQSVLLAAHRRCRIDVPFDRAMALPHLALCLRRAAMAAQRRRL